MIDLASSAIRILLPHLPMLARNSAGVGGKHLARRALYELVTSAFRDIGAEDVWQSYVDRPVDPATVERLLASALDTNPVLAENIARTVRIATNDNSSYHVDQSGVRAGGSVVGRDQDNSRHSTHVGGLVAVVAVVIVATVALLAGRAIYQRVTSGLGLSAGSTCAQFLRATPDDELAAIRKIGLDEGVAGIGSPLALPAISYSCSAEPNARLGDVIAKFKGQF